MLSNFWEQTELVEHFASRPPDKRLVELLRSYENPAQTRVLDLGCAGGRNTILLAEQGFDIHALDSSSAMVQKTRERMAEIYEEHRVKARIQVGTMQNLQQFEDEFFHLIVALGLYHNATCRLEWDAALKETARVLKCEGLLLVANFSPSSRPLLAVPEEPHVYQRFGAGPMFLLEADELDREMARFGLSPNVPTETVTVKTDTGQRVTVNALYAKQLGGVV